jgi:uncharacterized protein (DUF58 family)
MDRLRYHGRHAASAVLRWIRRRFTPAGGFVLAALVASAVLGVDTTESMAYQAFTFLLALLALSMTAGLFFRARLEVRRTLPRFGTAGQPLPYLIRVKELGGRAQRDLSLFEELDDPRPSFAAFHREPTASSASRTDRAFGLGRWNALVRRGRTGAEAEIVLPALPPLGVGEVSAQLTPGRRGRLRLRALTVARPDPLGLWRALSRRDEEQSVLILPRRYPVPHLALPGRRRYQQGGVALSSAVGDSQEFVSLRDYRAGDPLRKIHWKSWARTGKMIVKEHQDEYFIRHGLILDTFAPAPSELFEEAVSVAASFAASVLTQESLLDLLFVGAQAYCCTAGRGLGGAEKLLEVLAGVQPCTDKDFEELRLSVVRRHSELSGCIVILLAWDEPRRRFIEELRAHGVPALALVIGAPAPSDAVLPEGVHRLAPGKIAEGLARL